MSEIREAFEEAFKQAEMDLGDEGQTDEAQEFESDEDVSHETSDSPMPEGEETDVEEPEANAEELHAQENDTQKGKSPQAQKTQEVGTSKGKAPASWTPKARETWSKLPKEAQAQIAKRENEISRTLKETASARQMMQRLNTTLEPYKSGLIASGVQDPIQAIGTLFQTEAQLRGGDTRMKAQTVADLIKQYGVDIATLDGLLAGEAPSSGGTNPDIEQLIDQRMAPVNQMLQQQQQYAQYQEQQYQQEAKQSVDQFGQNAEFLNDVRMDMADMLEAASRRGIAMTLEQAYEKACAIHPEISKIIAGRKKEEQLMGSRNDVARKKAAASSLNGKQGGSPVIDRSNMSLRDSIEAAFNGEGI
jgi:hypothetical protein